MIDLPPSMRKGQRIALTADHTDEFGQRFMKGQTGVIKLTQDATAIIEFDGYEAERARAKEYAKRYGEAPNVVAWAACDVPYSKLAEIEHDD